MNVKNILITFLLLLVIGCTRKNIDAIKPVINDENAITVELFYNKSNYRFGDIKMSEFVDSVKFIILEEIDESLINRIENIIFTQEYVIVVDRSQGVIFFFDWDGKFVRKISRKGQGPGEYLYMQSCMIDEQQQLIIYDIQARKMLFYDLDGNFLRQISNFCEGALIRSIINLPNGHFLCYTYNLIGQVDQKYIGLWEVDHDGKFLRNHFTYKVILPVVHGGSLNFQQLQNGTISIKDQIHNDIYHYHNGIVERFITYNIKENRLPDMIDVEVYEDLPQIIRSSPHEKGDYIISLWYDEDSQPFFSLFSKKNQEIRYWDGYYSYDTNVSGIMYMLVDSNKSNLLVCNLNKDAINVYLADPNLPESVRNTLESLSQEIGDSDNPVLELLYIKE